MAVRVDRCKASGDCCADAHNLAEISPQHLARRLVIYTPTAAEIDELMDKARRDLPEIGSNEAAHRVVSHNPDTFWAIARRDRFSSRVRRARRHHAPDKPLWRGHDDAVMDQEHIPRLARARARSVTGKTWEWRHGSRGSSRTEHGVLNCRDLRGTGRGLGWGR
jgi:hypothetical protein